MSNAKVRIFLRFFEILLQCIVFVSLDILFSYEGVQYTRNDLGKCFLICIPVWLAYIFRKRIHGFFTFYILHFLLYSFVFIFSNSSDEFISYLLLISILVFYSATIKMQNMRNEDERMPFVALILIIINYFCGLFFHNDTLIETGFILTVLFIIFELLYENFRKINKLNKENKNLANYPATELFKVNMFMLFAFLILMIIVMLSISVSPDGDNAFSMLGKTIASLIGMFLKLFLKEKKIIETPTVETQTESETYSYLPNDVDSSFFNVANTILVIFTLCIVLIILIGILISFFRFLKSYRKKRVKGADLIEYVKPKSKVKRNVVRKNIKEELDLNQKLRKVYKHKIKKGIGKDKIQPNLLPEEITKKAISNESNVKVVTNLYEKARYSDLQVSQEEVDQLKNIKNT